MALRDGGSIPPPLPFLGGEMNIRVPITISPHVIAGKPSGYYILVHSLWKDAKPKIFRDQFAGLHDNCLILTMAHPSEWDSLLKAIIHTHKAVGKPSCWFAAVKQTRMGTGLRFYLPGTILKPKLAESKAIKARGTVRKAIYGSGDLVYVSVPKIDGDILLGRGDLV